ncbi:hypothetical protein FACS1894142_0900 [Spirochaetia bacterium]|nr:hypothetical protein FACS1894142_0900 [Spirochaetia bacterium]
MKIFALLWLVPCFLAAPLWSASLDDLIGADGRTALLRGDIVTEVQQKAPQPVLIPRHGFTRDLIDAIMADLSPGFLVESRYLYRKPAGAAPGMWSDTERTALYNEALALSTLAGIEYFSTSRNTMRTFYETSSIIDGPATKTHRTDPVYWTPPAELTVYAEQKDLTFGNNIYKYEYHARPDALVFVQENDTAMKMGIITAVRAHNLRSVVAVIDAGDYLLIYAASMAKAASVPGLNQRVGNSFSTRAEAMLKWFSGQADKAFKKAHP